MSNIYEVKTIGILHILGKEYPLVREETVNRFSPTVRAWSVIDKDSMQFIGSMDTEYKAVYGPLLLVASNADYLIEYRPSKYLLDTVLPEELILADLEQEEPIKDSKESPPQ